MNYIKQENIYFNKDVIADYVGLSVTECPGVVGMAMISLKDGIYKLLKKQSSGKGVEVNIENNKLNLNVHIIILTGININELIKELKEIIIYTLKNNLGLEINELTIFIEGTKLID